jgi:hypothetical protein
MLDRITEINDIVSSIAAVVREQSAAPPHHSLAWVRFMVSLVGGPGQSKGSSRSMREPAIVGAASEKAIGHNAGDKAQKIGRDG